MTAVGFGTPFLDNYFAALRKSRILFVVTLLSPLFQLWLSHLDALFVAVGTLTTAGTGNIVAIGEQARGFMLFQMVVDFTVVALTISLLLAQIARRVGSKGASH